MSAWLRTHHMRVWELEKSTSFSPESPLKKNLGTAALHGPIAEAKLQTSSAWSSTRFHEVENIRKICKQTITWMDFRFDKLIIFFPVPVRKKQSIHIWILISKKAIFWHLYYSWWGKKLNFFTLHSRKNKSLCLGTSNFNNR